jgi:hypothetical protein
MVGIPSGILKHWERKRDELAEELRTLRISSPGSKSIAALERKLRKLDKMLAAAKEE